ncbi:hypothetical protein R6Q59_015639 [Mikania micrantha]|uniref:Uncharacterized protein n=1 Tax=Mikania micrantha TaxID=192012 RepID=A0A5N6PHH7_9ASTR|nr:hypothetical protein E3N88_08553 [Mikania micrantha]
MSATSCSNSPEFDPCRDETTALILKYVAIATILVAGILGVAIPLVSKTRGFFKTDSSLFFSTKAFGAGVILATGFVHMLPEATQALTNPCLPEAPWARFPFSGLIAMMAALTTLLVDVASTRYYESKQMKQVQDVKDDHLVDSGSESLMDPLVSKEETVHPEGGSYMNPHAFNDDDDEGGVRHVAVSQVLELGILSHSILIGLSLGVSQSPCTIRPLLGALSCHQLFERFALGGCISQANLGSFHSTIMACFFAVTTPLGVGTGIIVCSFYNYNSPRALVIEGILDATSGGILIYMALVDLIAVDFMSKKMRCNPRLQLVSYIALFIGAGLMSLLAVWS